LSTCEICKITKIRLTNYTENSGNPFWLCNSCISQLENISLIKSEAQIIERALFWANKITSSSKDSLSNIKRLKELIWVLDYPLKPLILKAFKEWCLTRLIVLEKDYSISIEE